MVSWCKNWEGLATFFKYPPDRDSQADLYDEHPRKLPSPAKVMKGEDVVSVYDRCGSQMDGPGAKLRPNVAPALGLLLGAGQPTLKLGRQSPPRGLIPQFGCRVEEHLSSWIVCSPLTEPCLRYLRTRLFIRSFTRVPSPQIYSHIFSVSVTALLSLAKETCPTYSYSAGFYGSTI